MKTVQKWGNQFWRQIWRRLENPTTYILFTFLCSYLLFLGVFVLITEIEF